MWRTLLCSLVLALWGALPALAELPCSSQGPGAPTVLFQKPSRFGETFVVEQDGYRHLRFGSVCGFDQSSVSTSDPAEIATEYVRLAALSLALAAEHGHVLMIGLGGGTFSNLVARAWPTAQIDVVDVDPVVVEAATRFFGVEPSARYRVHVADAAAFLAKDDKHYDVIFLDTYSGKGMPSHLGSEQYFASAAKRLRPGGVLVANFGLAEPSQYIALARRLGAAAGDALCVSGVEEANLVVFAGKTETLRAEDPLARASDLDEQGRLPFSLGELALGVRDCL